MNSRFFTLVALLMLGRLPYLYDDRPLTKGQAVFLVLLLLVGLVLFQINGAWFALLGLLILLFIGIWASEKTILKKKKTRLIGRATSFLLSLLVFSLFTTPHSTLGFHQGRITALIQFLDQNVLFFDLTGVLDQRDTIQLILAGSLFLLNEANLIVRLIFQVFGFSPLAAMGTTSAQPELLPQVSSLETLESEEDYQAGRVIGILERLFVYYAVLQGVYSIVGFITAAKAFARFKELEKRAYAEYVLIGTLVSVLIAVATAWLTAISLR